MNSRLLRFPRSRVGMFLGAAAGFAALPLQAQLTLDFEENNPFSAGALVTDKAYSGNQSLFFDEGVRGTFQIPQEFAGRSLIVEMMIFDMGKWIDRSVTDYPTSSYGARWGVSTGEHANHESIGVSILERPFVNSAQGYGIQGINGEGNDTWFAHSWFSPTFMTGGREAELTPGTGGSYVDNVWQMGPGGVGRWSKWTFFVNAEGGETSITLNDTRTVNPHDIGGPITQIWFYGSRSQQNVPLGGVYVDDIVIRAAADANLVKVDSPPVIDGAVEDAWLSSRRNAIANVTNGVVPTDASDLHANWRGLYDADNFYLGINIRDESLNDSAASEAWMNDRIEVYFNMDNTRPAGNARTGDNYQYVFQWNSDEASVSGDGSLEGITWKQAETDDGWFVEIAFPWDTLFLNTPSAVVEQGLQFGFDVAVVDNDAQSSYDSIVFWKSQTGGLWGNMDSAGSVEMGRLFDGNYPPTISVVTGIQEAEIGQTDQFNITAIDLNGDDTLSFSGEGLPAFVALEKTADDTATVTITAQPGDANVYFFTVTVSDGVYSDSTPVYLVVRNQGEGNNAPVFDAVSTVEINQGETLDVHLTTTDLDSFSVEIGMADGAPEWASLVDNGDQTAVLTLAPALATVAGSYTVTVNATDAEGAVGSIDVTVEVIQITASEDWWNSYGDPSGESVDTGPFLGEIWFEQAPWFYQSQTESWLYVDNAFLVVGQGAWVYSPFLVPGPNEGPFFWDGYDTTDNWAWTPLGWLYVQADPYAYSDALNTWLYLDVITASGTWLYVFDLNDATPPSVPHTIRATPVNDSRIDVSWRPSTDDIGVTGYEVYRDGALIASVDKGTSFSDTSLDAEKTYTYTVSAYDAGGNISALSVEAAGTTYESRAAVDASWQAAWDSWDEATIEAWYHNNTGPIGIGIEEDDMWNPTTVGLTITQAWLEANEGNGNVFQENGRWVVQGVKAGWFIVNTSPVTLRGCLALLPSSVPGEGIAHSSSAPLIVEYCHVRAAEGVVPNVRGIEGSNLIVRNSRVGPGMDAGSGFRTWENAHLEYNWVHGLTGHHSGIAIRGNDTVARRNYSEIGTSASFFIYAHDTGAPADGLNNILAEENYINSPISYYGMNPGGARNDKAQSATNVRVVLNRWGEKNFWPDSSHDIGGSHRTWLGDIPAGDWVDARGNIWGGNHWIATGNYISPKTSEFAWDHPDHVFNDPWVPVNNP